MLVLRFFARRAKNEAHEEIKVPQHAGAKAQYNVPAMEELSNDRSKLRVLLVQLPVPNNPATNVPLATGYLKAHAHARGLLDRVELDILPRALADNAGDALL